MEAAQAIQGWSASLPAVSTTVGAGPWAATVTPAMDSGALSILQGKLTAQEMLMQKTSGVSGLIGGIGQSIFAGIAADQERAASEAKVDQIKREAAKRIGSTRVAMAASGVTVQSGDAIEEGITDDMTSQIGIERSNAMMRMMSAKMRGSAALSKGVLDLAGGLGRAEMAGTRYQLDLAKRG